MVFTGPGAIVHADYVQQGGLAGAGGSHDGDKLALLDVDIDAAQHVGPGGTLLEVLFDITE